MLELSNVRMPLDAGLSGAAGKRVMRRAAARALGVPEGKLAEIRLLKRSVDARKKSDVHFVAALAVSFAAGEDAGAHVLKSVRGVRVRPYKPSEPLRIPCCSHAAQKPGFVRPVVVGAGPAGLFCALYLAQAGLRPLLIERGGDVVERTAAVETFASGGALDAFTNVQFGEGGAGAFSDGKLTTGTKSPHIRHVLQTFVDAGAPSEILWQAKPHIGTDLLPGVVRALRERIVAAGGEVRFHAQLSGMRVSAGELEEIEVTDTRGASFSETYRLPARQVVLACGHSARDTFELLRDAGAALERKPFSVGVRIEHAQTFVNHAQYGAAATHPALGAADYKLAVHLPDGRGVYTFCMCPGGTVVAAASEEGGVCVNGMSRFARDGENANSALLVDVRPEDLEGNDVLAGVALQRRMEHAAYKLARAAGGAPYTAPAQTVGDFLKAASGELDQSVGGADSAFAGVPAANAPAHEYGSGAEALSFSPCSPPEAVFPTYPRGVAWCDLHECLPSFVAEALACALPLLERKLCGFADARAVMTGVETRSSSPVRVVRDESFQSPSVRGLYPTGEGAGYAGGIMSAAVDGLRVAESIAGNLASTAILGACN